jgi:hypothetical protein
MIVILFLKNLVTIITIVIIILNFTLQIKSIINNNNN